MIVAVTFFYVGQGKRRWRGSRSFLRDHHFKVAWFLRMAASSVINSKHVLKLYIMPLAAFLLREALPAVPRLPAAALDGFRLLQLRGAVTVG